MSSASQPTKAFYYPHIEFSSAAWVKSALLYWEGVARHIREPTEDKDPEIRALAEAGLIEDIPVWPYWPKITPAFGTGLERLLREHGKLPESIRGATVIRGHSQENLEAMQARVAKELDEAGCHLAAEAVRTNLPQTLTIYGTIAADVISRERNLAPVTDDPIFQAISTYFDEAKVVLDPRKVQAGLACAELLIPTPSIEAVAHLSVPRLLEVRKKLAENRRSFREKVEAYTSSIAGLPTVEAVNRRMKQFSKEIHEDVKAQRKAMKKEHVVQYWSILRVMAPASVAVGLAMTAAVPLAGPIGTIGAAALEATRWFIQRRNGGGTKKNYLLAVDEALGSDGQRGGGHHGLRAGLDKLLGNGQASVEGVR